MRSDRHENGGELPRTLSKSQATNRPMIDFSLPLHTKQTFIISIFLIQRLSIVERIVEHTLHTKRKKNVFVEL